jgi:hypothetical protein
MVKDLTIGSVWKSKKTNKEYTVKGYNVETGRVQLANINKGAEFTTFVDVKSLKKTYVEVPSEKKVQPVIIKIETVPVTVKPKSEIVTVPTAGRKFGKIELADGKVMLGINFLKEIVQEPESTIAAVRCGSVIYWLGNIEKGKAIMQKYNAKIVYDKPLTK